ncbi:MAG: apolipoprotein N-acyltransferase [Acidimicrobiales bacterium]|nr:MAG: apolipoprotein N-acyltransferase [Acidimicrobiales bacterium]
MKLTSRLRDNDWFTTESLYAPVGGLLIAASVPPWGFWPLALAGVAVWFRSLAGRPTRVRMTRSWLAGACWLAPSMLWMSAFTLPGYLVAVAAYAGFFAVAAAFIPSDRSRHLGFVACIALAEWARWHVPFGGVPLSTLAMSQAASPLGHAARLVGSYGLVPLVLAGGVGCAELAARRVRTGVCVLAAATSLTLAGAVAPRGRPVAPLRVAAVQGGGEQGTTALEVDPDVVFRRHLEATAELGSDVDLVVWPEDVLHVEGPVNRTSEWRSLVDTARASRAFLVAGVVEGIDQRHRRNVVVAIDPSGTELDRYQKVRLVPFGEFVPLRGLVERLAPESPIPERDMVPGSESGALDLPVTRAGIMISWEVFFSERARAAVLDGAEVLLNPTNGSSYWLTQVQTQQIASSRLRAIESGRWVVQAAPTGFTAFVDERGRVLVRSGIGERAVMTRTVELRSGHTIATRLGAPPIVLAAMSSALAAMVYSRRGRRPSDEPGARNTG